MPEMEVRSFPTGPTWRAARARGRDRLTGTFHGFMAAALLPLALGVVAAVLGYSVSGPVASAVTGLGVTFAAVGFVIGGSVLVELLPRSLNRHSSEWRVEERAVPGEHGFVVIGTLRLPPDVVCFARAPSGRHYELATRGLAPEAIVAILPAGESVGEYEVRWYSTIRRDRMELVRAKLSVDSVM